MPAGQDESYGGGSSNLESATDFADKEVSVIITISDKTGQEIFQPSR